MMSYMTSKNSKIIILCFVPDNITPYPSHSKGMGVRFPFPTPIPPEISDFTLLSLEFPIIFLEVVMDFMIPHIACIFHT